MEARHLHELARILQERAWLMCTAESCTGGLIAAACTDLPGSSGWFDRSYVTYSNQAKNQMLGVDLQVIATQGAVSEAVARAMVQGAVQRAELPVGVAVTGIAGPDGGSAAKPVGTVWLAWHINGQTSSQCCHFSGDRSAVRQQTVHHALLHLLQLLKNA